ncbi:phytanoyl-CoA dioxygenase family protein [Paenibacillus humicola]|uniref:phytanoyl-CoA dioxygenase family protein n=1 Tax=Paenibacillus humicola TaxID=3110540 RepID=UPI00237AAF03|nr:phytanoyl-CoA dioxygenase family protein [Paenibacillus humicola]
MKLTYEQREHLLEHGYVKLPGVVPKLMVDEAVKAINHSVGEGMDTERMPIFRSQSYCPELQRDPVITGLLNKTPIWELAESVIGEGKLKPAGAGQIALRFPAAAELNSLRTGYHLDGMHSPNNGVPKGVIANFTALVGVFLSDLPKPNAGNFTVWPGTHRLFEAYFREHGPDALLNGMPPVPMPEPVQITGQAGDAVLVHYQVAHGIGPNVSPNIRYACFFRLKHVDHDLDWRAPMRNIWLHWPGIQSLGR